MKESERIADQLRRAVAGRAWHGPSVSEALKGVNGRAATAHPIAGAHSIWELVLHLTVWIRVPLRRLKGKGTKVSAAQEWPAVTGSGESDWRRALADFYAAHEELQHELESVSAAGVARRTPGKKHNNLLMLDGVVQHLLYHAGQIVLLKKAQGRRPARRK